MTWLKKNLTTILLVVALVIGLCLLLYPTVSDYWNSLHQSRAIASYTESVAQIDNSRYQVFLDQARDYNARLAQLEKVNWMPTDQELLEYAAILDVSGTGVMCSIEIPKIKVNLPIFNSLNELCDK